MRFSEPRLERDVGECYDAIVQGAALAVGASECRLALYAPESDELIARQPAYGAPGEPLPRYRFPLDSAPASACVVRNREPYVSNDPAHDPLYHPSVTEHGVHSVLTVPVQRAGRVLGLVYALNKPGGFGPEDARTLRAYASAAAVWLESIELYEDLAAARAEAAAHARQLEERVKVADAKWHRLMTHANDAILVLDPAGVIRDVNDRSAELLGEPRPALVGRNFREFVAPGDDRAAMKQHLRLWSEGSTRGEALLVRHSSRSAVPVEFSGAIVETGGERLSLVIVRDVSQRKRAERVLAESERRFRLLFLESPVPMWLHDAGTLRILEANAATEGLYGYSRQELLGMHVSHLHPTAEPGPRPSRSGEESRHRHQDGAPLEVRLFFHDMSFDERPARLVVALDVTLQKHLEKQLRHSQKMEAIGRLAGGLAHDFGNVLTLIIGYGEHLLERTGKGEPGRHDLEQIHKAGQRAAALTRQLLAFSRHQILEPTILDLGIVVADIEKMLRRLIGEDIDLRTELAGGLKPVRADRCQLEQVIMNLAVNARDAMPGGGLLTIATAMVDLDAVWVDAHVGSRVGPHVVLVVSDSGCGMNAQTMACIFEPFFTTKEPGRGTGLGLSTVYGIVKNCGGHTWVESEPGKGSTFRVYLPAVDETPGAPGPQPQALERLRGSETLLVVEDDREVRRFTAGALRDQGYRVLEAADGVEALEVAAAEPGAVHAVVADVVMPRMGGAELGARLRAARPSIRVLYVSGYPEQALSARSLAPGEAFLSKPLSLAILAGTLRQLLEG